MPEQSNFQRRMPSPLVKIADIQPTDVRVSVIGMVIGKDDSGIVVDDGTGKLDVVLEGSGKGVPDTVRVFGKVIPTDSGCQLQGEIVQDMGKLDLELLKKVESIR